MPSLELHGRSIWFDEQGDGPAIVWSHGFLTDHSIFRPVIDTLPGHRHIVWDQRGFGSSRANQPFTFWDSADDAVAILDHLDITEAIFAGWSQGGFLSLRAALSHGDRVRGLVLISTAARAEARETIDGYRTMLDHWIGAQPLDDVAAAVATTILGTSELAEQWIPAWIRTRPTFTRWVGECLLDRDDISDRLGDITVPSLVVHGTADIAIDVALGRELAAALPDGDFVQISDVPHAVPMVAPAATSTAIEEFLLTRFP